MKLAGYVKGIVSSLSLKFCKGIVVTLSRQFKEEIVYALRRQLSQIYFGLPIWVFVQESLAQIHLYYNLLTVEEMREKKAGYWKKLPGEMCNEPQGQKGI